MIDWNDVAVQMGVLLGDASASRRVDAGDVFLVRQQNGEAANASNFRTDIDVSGRMDAGEVFLVRRQNGSGF